MDFYDFVDANRSPVFKAGAVVPGQVRDHAYAEHFRAFDFNIKHNRTFAFIAVGMNKDGGFPEGLALAAVYNPGLVQIVFLAADRAFKELAQPLNYFFEIKRLHISVVYQFCVKTSTFLIAN